MTSRKAIMRSIASSLSLVILAVFDDEDGRRLALQEVLGDDFVVGGALSLARVE